MQLRVERWGVPPSACSDGHNRGLRVQEDYGAKLWKALAQYLPRNLAGGA